MLYIIGNRETEELVARTGNYISSPPPTTKILQNISSEYDIPVSGLSIYSPGTEYENRILNGDDYDLVWSGVYNATTSGVVNTLVSLDFSAEDNKRLVMFEPVDPSDETIRKSEILGDGIDTARIMTRVYLPDRSEIDTSYNEELKLPFRDPDNRKAYTKINISGGIGYKDFKTTNYGTWGIPSRYNFEGKNAKIYNQIIYDIDVLMDI